MGNNMGGMANNKRGMANNIGGMSDSMMGMSNNMRGMQRNGEGMSDRIEEMDRGMDGMSGMSGRLSGVMGGMKDMSGSNSGFSVRRGEASQEMFGGRFGKLDDRVPGSTSGGRNANMSSGFDRMSGRMDKGMSSGIGRSMPIGGMSSGFGGGMSGRTGSGMSSGKSGPGFTIGGGGEPLGGSDTQMQRQMGLDLDFRNMRGAGSGGNFQAANRE